MPRVFMVFLLIAIVASGVAGYLTVNALCRGEMKVFVSNPLRGFIAGAFICGCLGMAAMVGGELKHGVDLVDIFKNVVVFSFAMALSGGMGGAMAVRRRGKTE